MDLSVEIDSERQRQALRYATQKRLLFLGQLGLGAAYLLVLLLTGLANDLGRALAAVPGGAVGSVAAYFIILWLAYTVLSFPFTVVGDWSLPRHYGLSVQSVSQWLTDWLKSEGIGLVIGLIVIEVVYALLRATPTIWWLISAALYVLFVVGLAHLGPILLLPLFFKLTPLDRPELVERLKALARQAGASVRGVYRMNLSAKTTAANAALTGLGNTRRVVLGDTLLDCYTSEEIEVVFAHELGHHVHHDIPRLIAGQAVMTLIALYLANLALVVGVQQLGFRDSSDPATIPLLALVLGLAGTVSSPLVNWVSRRMERAADCYALVVTDAPRAFASTMIRLANQNLAVYRPPWWVEVLFYDHPSIANRVTMAERYATEGQCG